MAENRPHPDAGTTTVSAPAAESEEELVRRAREGDLEAFEALYRRHVDRVHGLCLRLSGDPDRAEEATQEAFLRAWRKLPGFRGHSAFGTWLHRLAVNRAVGLGRRHGRHDERFVDGEGLPEPPAPGAGGDPTSRLALERAVAGLPSGARQVFVLYDLEGYSHDEIAELTGLAPGTSRAQLHRARQLLRKAFTP